MTSVDHYNVKTIMQPPLESLTPTATYIAHYITLVWYQGRKGRRVGPWACIFNVLRPSDSLKLRPEFRA